MNNYLEVDVKDVKGFKVDLPGQFDRLGNNIEADVVYASAYDAALSKLAAENLRAEMAEAELEVLRQQHAEQSCIFCNNSGELLSKVKAAEQRVSELTSREIVAETEGELTFMRGESDACGCCEGNHVFCRYFKGALDLSELSQEIRFRNELEGRRFRIVLELLPDAALNPKPEAGSHED